MTDALASLPLAEYVVYHQRIADTLGKKIKLNLLTKAVNEARRKQTSQRLAEYDRTSEGMVRISSYDGEATPLSNFTAEIVADVKIDDGAESTRSYTIEAMLADKITRFEVSAKDLGKCDWVEEHIGARAQITAGQGIKAHLINAIKSCSDPHEETHYSHTGWRKIDDEMVYLHAGGFLSQVSQLAFFSNGYLTQKPLFPQTALQAALQVSPDALSQVSQVSQVKSGVRVCLTGSLSNYAFPEDTAGSLREAIRASLRFLDLASDHITMPLYASLWRSPLGQVDYGVHVVGQTGYGKTELAALTQQHYGAAMTARHLPGSWESTENSLELLLFQAKDTLLVVDDFKPKGPKSDQDRLHAKADRVFRLLGNALARGRLTPEMKQRAERRPRCLLLSTGEDVPRGQSLKARSVVIMMDERITSGEPAKRLAEAQQQARRGVYAQAMAAYLTWLAPRIETLQEQFTVLTAEERDHLNIPGHARSSSNTAQMLLGMKCFLQFAYEAEAITEEEAQNCLKRCLKALLQVAHEAAQENIQEKPTEQWKRLVLAAISSQRAHVVDEKGKCPGLDYGWKLRTVGNGDETYESCGERIGWLVGKDLYLDPTVAYKTQRRDTCKNRT